MIQDLVYTWGTIERGSAMSLTLFLFRQLLWPHVPYGRRSRYRAVAVVVKMPVAETDEKQPPPPSRRDTAM